MRKPYTLITGQSEIVLKEYPENHFDSCVTDPPYGIRFMGKAWDSFDINDGFDKREAKAKNEKVRGARKTNGFGKSLFAGQYNNDLEAMRQFQDWTFTWAQEVYRVLKPGAHLLVFASPRTYHRMVCGLEEAGFEIRDQIFWVFASGFPKSSNQKGEWDGWGTALKPAHEPIVVARKPLCGTIPENLEKYGTGAMNIDACRIEGEPWTFGTQTDIKGGNYGTNRPSDGNVLKKNVSGGESGRWPANLIHDGSAIVTNLFPESKGQQGDVRGSEPSHTGDENTTCYGEYDRMPFEKRNDSGSASRFFKACQQDEEDIEFERFFYCAKTSRRDRNEGCEKMKSKGLLWSSGTQSPGSFQSEVTDRSSPNNHPTVKPTELMRYLIRLVTKKGGKCLDPFAGSGSTGKAAIIENVDITLIDSDAQWMPIQKARCEYAINNKLDQLHLFVEPHP